MIFYGVGRFGHSFQETSSGSVVQVCSLRPWSAPHFGAGDSFDGGRHPGDAVGGGPGGDASEREPGSHRRSRHQLRPGSDAAAESLLDLLANKWSTLVIGALEDGPRRFGELQRKLEGISPKVLTQTLRRLEAAGFIDRTIIPAVPLHVDYQLTELGHSAAVPLRHVRSWAVQNIDVATAAIRTHHIGEVSAT